MSYDINIVHCKSKKVVSLKRRHSLKGGTFALGGVSDCWLNITYNYAPFYYDVFGERGIRSIYGKTVAEAVPMLEKAIAALGDEPPVEDYWEATKGNARVALENLRALAFLAAEEHDATTMEFDGD